MRLLLSGRPLRHAAAALALVSAAPSAAFASDAYLTYTSRAAFEADVSGLQAIAPDAPGLAYANDGGGALTGPTPTSVAFTFSPTGSATNESFTLNLLGLEGNVYAFGFDYSFDGAEAGSLVANGTLGSIFGNDAFTTSEESLSGSGFFGVAVTSFPLGTPGTALFPESEIASFVASANGGTLTLTNLTMVSGTSSVVPEPATVTLLGLGLVGLAGLGAHRRRQQPTA